MLLRTKEVQYDKGITGARMCMAKRSKHQIEQDERTLLYELIKNSKEHIDTIAKNCGFSRQKTRGLIRYIEGKKNTLGVHHRL
jgi:hypothetical protein